jgi:hypothetical protein
LTVHVSPSGANKRSGMILLEELAKKEFCNFVVKIFYFVSTGMPQGSSLGTIFVITETKTYKIVLY